MKVVIDSSKCVGHARCAAIAPTIFVLNDDGYIEGEGFEVKPGDEEIVRRAVRACPERAIQTVE